jgi:hypothetical protein
MVSWDGVYVLDGIGIFVGGIFVGIASVMVRVVAWVDVGGGLAVLVGGIVEVGNSISVSLIDIETGIWSEDWQLTKMSVNITTQVTECQITFHFSSMVFFPFYIRITN